MRWTHRTYPYGPVWLVITIPLYLLGLGKFTLTLFWFKLFTAISYLVSVWLIKKILEFTSPKNVSLGMVLFALNPLIIIESLVTAHIDIAMCAIFLFAIYLILVRKKTVASWIALLSSAAIKFITFSAIPVWLWWKGKRGKFEKAVITILFLLFSTTLAVIVFKEPLPWYFITPLAVASLVPDKKGLVILSFALSLGMLLRYTPFILKGEYSEWVKLARNILTLAPLLAALPIVVWLKRRNSSSFLL
jgi:hypothetical protein